MTTPTKTILAATDFSPRGDLAVERAARIAGAQRARLEVVHVLPGSAPIAWWREPAGDEEDQVHARRSEGQLEAMAARLSSEQDIEVSTARLRGAVAPTLAEHAAKVSARLVVVGATGAGAVARRLLGSSSQALLRASPVPVLVVRTPAGHDYGRVVFATDFTDAAQAAITEGLAVAPGAGKVFFSALDEPRSRVEPFADLDELTKATRLQAAREAARDRLGTLAALTGHDGASIIVRDGRPSEEIPVVVNETGADLLCLGSGHHPALARLVLGSTSAHAVAEAGSDVLVVPHQAA